mgnify:CR=1 FL=1
MKIAAVIPARKGSRRLPNKHLIPFGNSNLLVNKINQLKQVELIDEIVVSTDCSKMIEVAKQESVHFLLRPTEYCDEMSKTFNEVVAYIASNIQADILLWSPCVCPIVGADSYQKALISFLSKGNKYDSVVSAMPLKEYIFDEQGPINFSIKHHVPTQLLPDWFIITNGFFIANRNDMIKWKFVYGNTPLLQTVSKFEAIDIDDRMDFELAEHIYQILQKDGNDGN